MFSKQRRMKIKLNLSPVSGVLRGDRTTQTSNIPHQLIMNSSIITLSALALALGFAASASAEVAKLPPASDKQGVTYATDIKPILDASCVKCHSGDKPKARLRLDTLEGIFKGAKSGKIVTAGDSANSFIVKAAAHATADKDSWMPPIPNKAGAKTLTPEQIGLVRAWIDQGAK
jgi:mono/diheme cytochrome c family protein